MSNKEDVKPGSSLWYLNKIEEELWKSHGIEPGFKKMGNCIQYKINHPDMRTASLPKSYKTLSPEEILDKNGFEASLDETEKKFLESWKQAMFGEFHPIEELWKDIED